MTTFISDPFEEDINLVEMNGQKLFTLAISKRDKEANIIISQESAANVMFSPRQDSNSFECSIITDLIETPGGNK